MEQLFAHRASKLFFYSPYNFIRVMNIEKQLNHIIKPILDEKINDAFEVNIDAQKHLFFYDKLAWDTRYFNLPMIKMTYVLFSHNNEKSITKAVNKFLQYVFTQKYYVFIEIPSEDILLIQALGNNGFKLIETRLNYYRGNLANFNETRYPVRQATESDSNNLMRVARMMRNDYDRFHADSVFSAQTADDFLATYIEQSLKGFSDVVLTPNEPNLPSDSFLTAKYLKSEWSKLGVPVSKMVLSAVSSTTNKGWYKKLISEMTYHLREEGAAYIFMNTQSTNRAVFHTWEQLGYCLGSTSHVLSINNI